MSTIEHYNLVTKSVGIEVSKFTLQLFDVKDHFSRLPPSAFASSVLMKLNERHFLLTAAHCVHGFNLEHIGFMIGNDFFTIGGNAFILEPNEDEFEVNNADCAVFELHSSVVELLKIKYNFWDWSQVDLNHHSTMFSRYVIFGYPEARTRKHFPTKQIVPQPLLLRTCGVNPEYYFQDNVDRRKTIVLNVDQSNIGEGDAMKVVSLPNLGGISGCGVWHVADAEKPPFEYKLAGIVTGEGDNKTVLYMSSTRNVDYILKNFFAI